MFLSNSVYSVISLFIDFCEASKQRKSTQEEDYPKLSLHSTQYLAFFLADAMNASF